MNAKKVTFTDDNIITNCSLSNLNIWRNPVCNYIFKVNNRNTRIRCEISSKLIIKTPERRHWRHSGVFTVKF